MCVCICMHTGSVDIHCIPVGVSSPGSPVKHNPLVLYYQNNLFGLHRWLTSAYPMTDNIQQDESQ